MISGGTQRDGVVGGRGKREEGRGVRESSRKKPNKDTLCACAVKWRWIYRVLWNGWCDAVVNVWRVCVIERTKPETGGGGV